MKTIFGIIQKQGVATENIHLVKRLREKSADFEVFKGQFDFTFGTFSGVQSHEVYRIGSLVAICDARIDNKKELCQKLSILSSEQNDITDTQLILKCFQQWNKACFDFLDGDFAIAIFNTESQELVLATDYIGQRQLYYYDAPDCFVFCSHLKELTTLVDAQKVFNSTSIVDYFFRLNNPQNTFYKNTYLLTAGNYLTFMPEKPHRITQYWQPSKGKKYQFLNEEDWYDCARELITRAIIKRVNNDGKIGLTLSGGLDSSSIACILANALKEKNKPLYTFSSVLPLNHHTKDERPYIEALLKLHENIIPSFIELSDSGTFTNIEQHFYIDEAFPNTFHYVDHAILQVARENNISNLFTGYGGDFWVSWKGGSVIYQLFLSGKYQEGLALLKASRQYHKHSLFMSIKTNILAHTQAYMALKGVLKPEEFKHFFKDEFYKSHAYLLHEAKGSYIEKTLTEVISGKIGRILTMLRTRNQYYGMESSVPLLDKSLLEFFLEVPSALFIKDGVPRNIIRESMKHIMPDYIRLRRDKLAYAPDFDNRLIEDKKQC